VARSQGNYASTDQIAADIREKFGSEHIGLVFAAPPLLWELLIVLAIRMIAFAQLAYSLLPRPEPTFEDRRDWRTRNNLAHLRNINAVVHLSNTELDNFKFIRSCFKQDSFSLFSDRLCHLSLSPMLVNIVCYALYSPFGGKILPILRKN